MGRVGINEGGRSRRKGLRGRKVSLPLAEHPPVSTRWHRCYSVPEKATQHIHVYRFGFIVIQHCHEIYICVLQDTEETFVIYTYFLGQDKSPSVALYSVG